MVLMIACVNVANMLLARSFARRREMAVRTALRRHAPAGRRQLLVESLALALARRPCGARHSGCRLQAGAPLGAHGSATSGRRERGLDLRVLLFVGRRQPDHGVGFGLVPAWQSSHTDPNDALRNTRRVARTLFGRFRVSDLLIVAQVALALTLLVGAGLLVRSLRELMHVPSGIRPEGCLTLGSNHRQWQGSLALIRTASVPTSNGSSIRCNLCPESRPLPSPRACPSPPTTTPCRSTARDSRFPGPASSQPPASHTVSPDYFRVMGIPLLRGRLFDGHEKPYAVPPGLELAPQNFGVIFKDVVFDGVVSQRMAARYWPGEDPVGKRFRLGPPELQFAWVQIVGVVGSTTQFGLDQGETTEFYLSLRQWPVPAPMHLAVRTRMAPAAAVGVDPSAPPGPRSRTSPYATYSSCRSALPGQVVEGREFSMGLFTSFAGAGPASVLDRHLRRALVRRGPAYPRDRHSDGARRGAQRCHARGLARGLRLALPGCCSGSPERGVSGVCCAPASSA